MVVIPLPVNILIYSYCNPISEENFPALSTPSKDTDASVGSEAKKGAKSKRGKKKTPKRDEASSQ